MKVLLILLALWWWLKGKGNGEPPPQFFNCPYCSAQFGTEGELNTHILMVHGILPPEPPPSTLANFTGTAVRRCGFVWGQSTYCAVVPTITNKTDQQQTLEIRYVPVVGSYEETRLFTFAPREAKTLIQQVYYVYVNGKLWLDIDGASGTVKGFVAHDIWHD